MEQTNINVNLILGFCLLKSMYYANERVSTTDNYWEIVCRSKEDILEDIIEYINSLSKK